MELRRTAKEQVAGLRAVKQGETDPPITPGFYKSLAADAEPFLIVESDGVPAEITLGYVLLLARQHQEHTHTTLVELGLRAGHRDRYEDVLDLIKDEAKPTAYLVRTDDCRLNATLLARGLQVEATALVLVPEKSAAAHLEGSGATTGGVPEAAHLQFAALRGTHVAAIAELLEHEESSTEKAPEHHHGPTAAETLEQIRGMAAAGEGWVLLADGSPQAVIAHLEQEGGYRLLDFVLAQGEEASLAWAFRRATEAVVAAGRKPAAVIDALDPVRRRILRAAGWYTVAAYMVFYDPMAGRPSVPTVTLQALQDMMRSKEHFHLVDVMGEEHWKAGHLPGAEWIDFRGLGREARKRYRQDDTIVVYCNGFT